MRIPRPCRLPAPRCSRSAPAGRIATHPPRRLHDCSNCFDGHDRVIGNGLGARRARTQSQSRSARRGYRRAGVFTVARSRERRNTDREAAELAAMPVAAPSAVPAVVEATPPGSGGWRVRSDVCGRIRGWTRRATPSLDYTVEAQRRPGSRERAGPQHRLRGHRRGRDRQGRIAGAEDRETRSSARVRA